MNLATFLRVSASGLSAVHRGVAFEQKSLNLLQENLSMTLRRVGGRSDGGIDLQGWWWLPTRHGEGVRRIRVLGQCKAEKKKMGPNYVREMEGVLHRFTFGNGETPNEGNLSNHPAVALLISQSPFTKSTLLRAQSSPIPFFLLHLPPPAEDCLQSEMLNDSKEDFGAAFWNPALGGESGLLGGDMEVRWERSLERGASRRIGLWWKRKKLPSQVPEDCFDLIN